MCTIRLILASVFMVAAAGLAQPPEGQWTRAYGVMDDEEAFSIQATGDNGYIIAGHSRLPFGNEADMYLVKIGNRGDTLWTRTYDWGEALATYSVVTTSDGGYVIAGSTGELVVPYYDFYIVIMKVDSTGNEVWRRQIGNGIYQEDYYADDLQPTSDGGFVVSGRKFYSVPYILLIKVDSTGVTEWLRQDYGYGRAWSCQQTSDGGYIMGGYWHPTGGHTDCMLIKTNSAGDTSWTRRYGGDSNDQGYSVQQTLDGGYILGGWTNSFGVGGRDFYVVKTDSVGDVMWTQTFGDVLNDHIYSAMETHDGGFIFGGYQISLLTYSYDGYVVRTDRDGILQWQESYGGGLDDYIFRVKQAADHGFIFAGTTASMGAGGRDFYVIKTEPEGGSGAEGLQDAGIPEDVVLHECYPNPFNSTAVISYELRAGSRVSISVHDVLGRRVTTLVNSESQPGKGSVVWDADELPSGIYFVRLEAGEFVQMRKVVLLK